MTEYLNSSLSEKNDEPSNNLKKYAEQFENFVNIDYEDVNGDKVNFDDDTWKVVWSYIRDQPNVWVAHQINSYNDCIDNMIPDIIHDPQYNPLTLFGELDPETKQFNLEYQLRFHKFSIAKPIIQENNGANKIMTPNDARIRTITYAANLYVDMEHSVRFRQENGEWGPFDKKMIKNVMIGKIPIMLGSKYCILSEKSTESRSDLGECRHDKLGYFIIKGSEKVLVSQERLVENKPIVHHLRNMKYSDICDIKSVVDGRFNLPKSISVRMLAKDSGGTGRTIRVNFQGVKADIPIFILFRALGIESDKQIIKMILYDLNDSDMFELIKPSLEEGIIAYTQEEAVEELIKHISLNIISTNLTPEEKKDSKIKFLNEILTNNFLPHVGSSFENKAYYLGYMTNRLLNSVLNRRNYDDRDHYANKKIDTAGCLLAYLFALNFRQKLLKTFQREIRKDFGNLRDGINNIKIEKYIKPTIIDTGLKRSFAMGDWGLKASSHNKSGVSQVLKRENYKSALSHCRRIITPMDKTRKKIVGPHMLHGTQWFHLCPSETPDGEQIGISKNLAITCYITDQTSPEPVNELLKDNNIEYLEEVNIDDIKSGCKIFVNGIWVGLHYSPDSLYKNLIQARRDGFLHIHTSITWNHEYSEIFIYTDAGRCIRPLYIVDQNKIRLTKNMITKLDNLDAKWSDLMGIKDSVKDETSPISIIEYIDCNEAEKMMIAVTPKDLEFNSDKNPIYKHYTHCEIHPSLMFGVVISDQPFSNHNQSPRVIYYGNMGKQSIGVPTTNFNNTMDTLLHVLHYPQKPIISTRASRLIPGTELPSGQMAMVAIACYSGYNQEDSVIVNQNAIDRGLFVSTYYRRYSDEEKKNHQELQDEQFTKPSSKNVINPKENIDALEENGFARIGAKVKGDDVIIGKLLPIRMTKDGIQKYKDTSTTIKRGENGYIDDVKWNINGDGYRFCKVKIRSVRTPQIGDKVSSRAAQKGTIGMILPQEDMPFNKDGISPDIIINPHAIPSRMTIGQLMESVFGKVCCLKGFEGDGTPFNGVNVKDICKILGTPVSEGGCGMTEEILENGTHMGYGDEILYNGMTGEQLRVKIFMGPTYYHRLKHMVDDKVHSRAHGPCQILTRQPTEGRSRGGGLRLGEMERDCLIAHGIAFFLKEKYLDSSDEYTVYINRKNGLIAIGDPNNGTLRDDITDAKPVVIPYTFKLLIQELMAIGICPRLVTH